MGFSVNIVAMPIAHRDAFLEAASVALTEQDDPNGEGPVSAAIFGEHYVVWRNLRVLPMFSEPDWLKLSQACPLLVLDVVDTAGAQVLRFVENGEECWVVSFEDSNDDLLLVEGPAPDITQTIRQKLRTEWLEQHPEDAGEPDKDLVAGYGLSIPSMVFEHLTGGLYYEDGPPEGLVHLSGDLPQIQLSWKGERKDPDAKPWWKIW